ncbi:polysaccharide biosynthesis/export family protein [Dyadobacter sandarakinus]|uniref:Polysaccharide biosynthesis/export family protein n=1 Tax=Dyadobacter sandarakinus TaxID=2747268 RepID=A0ABX7I0W1_9BACT|nr:polysaccharide biosynthesis/export family protein [Dyadobacter sandarakinus]QRQ99474.1 polysaccharide biosynthesis/export family protein [Dyadobacter sandarakinus]
MKIHRSPIFSISIVLLLACIGILGGTSSCVSPKTIVYFQGDTARLYSSKIKQSYVPLIESNDMLSIIVGSLNQEANAIFNSANEYSTALTTYGGGSNAMRQPFGYLVDQQGNIELPLVGKIKVGSLTTRAAGDTIRQRLQLYLKEPSVNIKNINFKVSVLGEVAKPSVYVIPDERLTLPEVLSLAGDLTIYGRRNNVMVIREEKGERIYARLDLTSRDVFESPFYYMHKNDVIYVEPVKARMNMTDRTIQLAPLFVSILTAVVLAYYRLGN